MAQQQRRPGSAEQTSEQTSAERTSPERGEARPGPQAMASAPFDWWSNMADTQREFLSNVMKKASETGERNENKIDTARDASVSASSAALGQNFFTTASDYQRELARFITDRLTKDQAFMTRALTTVNLQQLMQLQAGWMTQAMQDYGAEFSKLANILKQGDATRR